MSAATTTVGVSAPSTVPGVSVGVPAPSTVPGVSVGVTAASTVPGGSGAIATPTTGRRAVWEGVRAALPLLAALVPLGLVVGASAADTGPGPLLGWSTSWAIYGATAQLVALRLLDSGAGPIVVVATVLLVNVRLAAYGAAMAPAWRHAAARWKILAAGLLVEPAYIVADTVSPDADERHRRQAYLGAALTFFGGWQVITLIGVVAGGRITGVVPADLALAVVLVAMLVGVARRSRPSTVAALVAGSVGLVATGLPHGTGTLLAASLGVTAAVWAERRAS